ncbi:MAG: uroporphyrinogen-III C-methyltransferase [Azonexus sp.]|jgi:uroporphyrin-3 C-methyltransferase|nr:uroporphyrinogen-III C-methyltransferase [Azonexus sp.]
MSTENTTPETPPELPPPAADKARSLPPRRHPASLWLILGVVFCVAAVAWVAVGTQKEYRLAETAHQEERSQLKAELDSLHSKLAALEARQSEFENQGAALRATVDNLSINNEETALREIELALTLGAQQLQLAANVSAATLALETAAARLSGLDEAHYQPLRAAIARDLARLQAQPQFDIARVNYLLEDIIGQVDKLPLAEPARPAAPPTPAEPAAAEAETAWWRLAAADVWRELRGLVRSQRMDREEPPLLVPEQMFFLRENLKLRLLDARLALHARDQETLRNDLKAADDWLQRFFAANAPAVQEIQGQLRQLNLPAASGETPNLSDSLTALSKLRGEKEAR